MRDYSRGQRITEHRQPYENYMAYAYRLLGTAATIEEKRKATFLFEQRIAGRTPSDVEIRQFVAEALKEARRG